MRKRTWMAIVAASAFASLATAANADAQITVGQLAPGTTASPLCVNSPLEEVPRVVGSANIYAAPTSGVITSWSTYAAEGPGQVLNFKVFRPLANEANNEFLIVARDSRALTPGIVNTFKVSIPVAAGDLIGDQDGNATQSPDACVFNTGDNADITSELQGDAAAGETIHVATGNGGLLPNVTATLLPPPTIPGLGTTSGTPAGGSSVTIAGTNFAEVKGVTFGSTPALYTIDSEGQITATSPAVGAGSVPVTVTTVAGTATSPVSFTYASPAIPAPPPVSSPVSHCVVPKLKGKKLKAAKQAIRTADCKVGTVTKKKGVTAKTGEVVKQSPEVGASKAAGSKVSFRLG